MKERLHWYLLFILFLFALFYVPHKLELTYSSKHLSLNQKAFRPDIEIQNARRYAREDHMERTQLHVQKAMYAINEIKQDVDIQSGEVLQDAIAQLGVVHEQIEADCLDREDMSAAFDYALCGLALAELRVCEMYAETNNEELAFRALNIARTHLKNALRASSGNENIESQILVEMETLIEAKDVPPAHLTQKIDELIEDMDEVVAKSN